MQEFSVWYLTVLAVMQANTGIRNTESIIAIVTGIDGVQTEDLGFAVLQYPNAVSVVRMGGTEVGGFSRRNLVVCGSERTVEICPMEAAVPDTEEKYMLYTGKTERYLDENGQTKCQETQSEPFQRYSDMLCAFAQMVRGEKENPYTLEYELELFRVLMKCCGCE